MRRVFLILIVLLTAASSVFGSPKNVILLIGDGMGVAHVAAARIATGSPDGKLAMDAMPVTGFVTTYSANALVTDSAAAGTALACGIKTNNSVIGQTPDGQRAKSILEAARDIGKATGIVTTTAVVDATPASFAAHVPTRAQVAEIAVQLISANVDMILGGGRALFIPKDQEGSSRKDDRNLLAEAAAKGYTVVGTADELNNAKDPRMIGLFALGNLTSQLPEPSLSVLTRKAIDVLSADKDGFFLMVEGGMIDKYAHGHNIDAAIRETTEFDRAVAAAIEFATRNRNTLVIVTADHETGGLVLLSDGEGKLKASWGTAGHSGVPVPLYAFGRDSDRFAGLIDNTQVSQTIADLWKVKIGP